MNFEKFLENKAKQQFFMKGAKIIKEFSKAVLEEFSNIF